MQAPIDTENVVRDRYTGAAEIHESSLCCPVDYDPQYLEVIPEEVLTLDYGCGDPSRHLKRGETVLDLGSGAGKICFIASQIVGPEGLVIGIDMTPKMLEIARRNAISVGNRLGYSNVEFRRGLIQDLSLDLDSLESFLLANPVKTADDFMNLASITAKLRQTNPLVADNSVDVVISNCVLNLVDKAQRHHLFKEIFRVLRFGGRIVISDIVSSESVPISMQNDKDLWSGCISGAMTETEFLAAFEAIGFQGLNILEHQSEPWKTVRDIEFRSMTIEAFKPSSEKCSDETKAIIYRGPFKEVLDDDGHKILRGDRYYVCEKTYSLYSAHPFKNHFIFPEEPATSKFLEKDEKLSESRCCS